MISIFTMERPAMSPTAAPVGAALAAFPPVHVAADLSRLSASAQVAGVVAYATGEVAVKSTGLGAKGIAGVKPNAGHAWTTRDRQVGITTLRSARHLRSPRT